MKNFIIVLLILLAILIIFLVKFIFYLIKILKRKCISEELLMQLVELEKEKNIRLTEKLREDNIEVNNMERLTPEYIGTCSMSPWDYCGLDKDCKRDCFKPIPCKIPYFIRQLADYESTGLTPEEINHIVTENSKTQ